MKTVLLAVCLSILCIVPSFAAQQVEVNSNLGPVFAITSEGKAATGLVISTYALPESTWVGKNITLDGIAAWELRGGDRHLGLGIGTKLLNSDKLTIKVGAAATLHKKGIFYIGIGVKI